MKNEKLELLSLAKSFEVKKTSDGFDVTMEGSELAACIAENGDIEYFRTGCYNSGCDWMEIPVDELQKLKNFCELLTK